MNNYDEFGLLLQILITNPLGVSHSCEPLPAVLRVHAQRSSRHLRQPVRGEPPAHLRRREAGNPGQADGVGVSHLFDILLRLLLYAVI